MTPYYTDDSVTLYHGDCRDVLPQLGPDCADLTLTDPPYGIDKGSEEWDAEFTTDWLQLVATATPTLGLMPGVWNILRCPPQVGRLRYRWTIAGHLANGMTRGAIGYGNWIPCLVYDASDPVAWCSAFANWCRTQGLTCADLDAAAGTSDMGGWWASNLAHRAQIPTSEQWVKLQAAFSPPAVFGPGVRHASRLYRKASDAQRIVVGRDDRPAHPSPKPLSYMVWVTDRLSLGDDTVLDPFAGSGTTLLAASQLGRKAIGVEENESYCELIAQRLANADVPLFGGVA